MYELKERVNQFDQEIFSMKLEERLLLPTRQLRIWTAQFTPVIAKAVVTAQLQGMRGHQDIRNYFAKLPNIGQTRKIRNNQEVQPIQNKLKQKTIFEYTKTENELEVADEQRQLTKIKTPHKVKDGLELDSRRKPGRTRKDT